tara:strand:+ start:764 stop:1165 length:402 start_codon:yes stop_codon:yes gene_type:complete
MNKILKIVVLGLLLSGNAYAEEIILTCNSSLYKYVDDGTDVKYYSSNKKRDKGKWHEWPTVELKDDNKDFFISIEGSEVIKDGYKITHKGKKIVNTNGIAKNFKTTINFKAKSRSSKGIWNGKKYSVKEKCKV